MVSTSISTTSSLCAGQSTHRSLTSERELFCRLWQQGADRPARKSQERSGPLRQSSAPAEVSQSQRSRRISFPPSAVSPDLSTLPLVVRCVSFWHTQRTSRTRHDFHGDSMAAATGSWESPQISSRRPTFKHGGGKRRATFSLLTFETCTLKSSRSALLAIVNTQRCVRLHGVQPHEAQPRPDQSCS